MFLKAGTDVSSYSQQPSPRSFVYVRGLGSAQQSTELVSSLGCAADSQYLLEEQGRDLQPAQSFCQIACMVALAISL
jgi:hypothetical protein